MKLTQVSFSVPELLQQLPAFLENSFLGILENLKQEGMA